MSAWCGHCGTRLDAQPDAAELRGLQLMRDRTESRHPWSLSNDELGDVAVARAWLDRKVSP